jgi:hypothetical protein
MKGKLQEFSHLKLNFGGLPTTNSSGFQEDKILYRFITL